MPITRRELEKLKEDFDPDAREFFLTMSREDQLIALFSIGASNSNRLAVVEMRQINFEGDIRRYREKRERLENGDDEGEDKMSTTQKIVKMIEEERARQFNFPLWFRDRVLPGIVQLVTLALLYFIFGGKVPTP